jgi:hypothetical protein
MPGDGTTRAGLRSLAATVLSPARWGARDEKAEIIGYTRKPRGWFPLGPPDRLPLQPFDKTEFRIGKALTVLCRMN